MSLFSAAKRNTRVLARAAMVTGAVGVASASFVNPLPAHMHCQVPCGIFDDPARVATLEEHAKTIRKAQGQIKALSLKVGDPLCFNQSVRWVMTKEEAAKDIIEIVSNYMLAQRVKKELFASEHDYLDALSFHHTVMQAAMKAKQNVSPESADALDASIAELKLMYTK